MGAGSFINDPIDPQLANVDFAIPGTPEKPYIYIKAKRKIKRKEELLISYRNSFWRRRGGKPKIREYSLTYQSKDRLKMKFDRIKEYSLEYKGGLKVKFSRIKQQLTIRPNQISKNCKRP